MTTMTICCNGKSKYVTELFIIIFHYHDDSKYSSRSSLVNRLGPVVQRILNGLIKRSTHEVFYGFIAKYTDMFC